MHGDKAGNCGQRCQIDGAGLGIDEDGEEGDSGEIGMSGELAGTGAEGPGHGAVDISRAEKNRDKQGKQNPRGAAAEIQLPRKYDDAGAGQSKRYSENSQKVWRAHPEHHGEQRCHHRREREHDGGKAAADFRDH